MNNIKDIIHPLNFEKFSLILIISIITANFFLVKCADSTFTGKYKKSFFSSTKLPTAIDFHINYVAAKYLNLGLDIYQEHPETGMTWEIGCYPYGPIVAYIFSPFTIFPEHLAYGTWLACIVVITLFSFLLFSKYFKDKYLFWLTVLVITAFSYPFKFMLERGNLDHLIYLCLILVFYFYVDRRNEVLIGLFLSIAVLMKLYPGIFILYFLIKKEWKILLWTFLFSSVLIFLTSFNGAYAAFYEMMRNYIGNTRCNIVNHSLKSILTLTAPTSLYRYLFPHFFHQKYILTGIYVLILAGLYTMAGFTLIKNKSKTIKTAFLEFSMVIVLMTVTAPTSHDYNLVITMFVTIALLHYWQSFFLDRQGLRNKEIFWMIIFIFSTIYLYISPVLNFRKIPWRLIPHLGTLLWLLGNKFWPLMLYFFLVEYLLLKEGKNNNILQLEKPS